MTAGGGAPLAPVVGATAFELLSATNAMTRARIATSASAANALGNFPKLSWRGAVWVEAVIRGSP
jgi:hypothetical protein